MFDYTGEEMEAALPSLIASDYRTLKDMSIDVNCRVNLTHISKIPLCFRTKNGETFTLNVAANDTIMSIKTRLQNLPRIQSKIRHLVFWGRYMIDDEKKLTDFYYHRKNDEPLLVRIQFSDIMSIFCKTLTGKTIVLKAKPPDTILRVKTMTQGVEGILPGEQRLIWSGVQLQDACTLDEYGIGWNVILHLVLELRGGGVSSPVA